jgi:hypothetical protein
MKNVYKIINETNEKIEELLKFEEIINIIEENKEEGYIKIQKNQKIYKIPNNNIIIINNEENEKIKMRNSLIIMNTIKYWITNHFYDFDVVLILILIQFLNSNSVKNLNLSSTSIKLISTIYFSLLNIDNKEITNFNHEKYFPPSIIPKKINFKNKFYILDWSPIEIARQITIIDFDIFKNIKPNEYFNLGKLFN